VDLYGKTNHILRVSKKSTKIGEWARGMRVKSHNYIIKKRDGQGVKAGASSPETEWVLKGRGSSGKVFGFPAQPNGRKGRTRKNIRVGLASHSAEAMGLRREKC